MIDAVVGDPITHLEGRLVERGRTRPAEAHALIAGHVDDQGAGGQSRQVGFGEEHHRRVRVRQHAVDDEVVLGEEAGQVLRPVVGDRLADIGRTALSLKCTICTEWIGAATAAISRWVSTRTSVTPSPFSPVTAPRAVAPKPITTARRFGP